jgi:hypothetical protein
MKTLKNIRHCRYCELHKFQLNKGIICTLTGEQGLFSNTCPKISFSENLYAKIFEVEIAIQ